MRIQQYASKLKPNVFIMLKHWLLLTSQISSLPVFDACGSYNKFSFLDTLFEQSLTRIYVLKNVAVQGTTPGQIKYVATRLFPWQKQEGSISFHFFAHDHINNNYAYIVIVNVYWEHTKGGN